MTEFADGLWSLWLMLRHFLDQGGDVLVAIMAVMFVLWWLILERLHFFWFEHKKLQRRLLDEWRQRRERYSWSAHQIRQALLSVARTHTERNLGTIRTVILVAPLLGLLGTVTGMVDVFDVMAVTGSSNSRAMAAGVSRATIPTMAGMVVSLIGLLFNVSLSRRAKLNNEHLANQFELEEAP